ncbi:MAG TPA: hypothetical protein PKA54_05010 [Chitinophagaceae bacterium]|nr:hypothetical protein [Chitinophagaceae bacterium]
MKKRLISFIAILFISTQSFAQNADLKPSLKVQKEIEVLKKADLGLTEIQLHRITYVLIGEESNYKRIEKAFEGNKTQLEIYSNELFQNKINNIKGTMTPPQAEKFDQMKLVDKLK